MSVNVVKICAVLSLIFVSGCVGQPQISQNNCKIAIERPENNGAINIFPCTIKISSGQKAVLRGGESDSFFVKPSTYFLAATSLNPYPAVTKNSDWKSNSIKITVTNSQIVKIIVEPKSEDSAYVGGWVLQQQP